MNEKNTFRLSEHWATFAISVASSGVVVIISLVTYYVNARIDYAQLKQTVNAQNLITSQSANEITQLLTTTTQINQKVTDDHQAIHEIHQFLFSK
jgi:hypothetical protein